MNGTEVNSAKLKNNKITNVKVNSVKVNNEKEKREKEKKEWKQFKSNYTFLILALLLYALRPLQVNNNKLGSELSNMTEIISKNLSIENYKEELNNIIILIKQSFIKNIKNNNYEEIMKMSKTKDKILNIIKLLLNVSSYKDFYSKMITSEPLLTNNKEFFNFIASLISFSNSTKSVNREKSVDSVIYLIKRIPSSPLNEILSKVNNQINEQINGKTNGKNNKNNIAKYKDILIKIAASLFKNMAENNSVNFVNSNVVLKKNINTIPVNSNPVNSNLVNSNPGIKSIKNNGLNSSQIGGNRIKVKSINIKNMWWLKKYR